MMGAAPRLLAWPLMAFVVGSPWWLFSPLLETRDDALHFAKPVRLEQLESLSRGSNNTNDHAIPHLLIFTHETNLLSAAAKTKDLRLFDNLVATIDMYAQAWKNNETTTKVWFLDDAECQRVIAHVEPRLLPYFQHETVGAFRGDVCRGAALYLSGGYYFDADMKAIAPLQLRRTMTLSVAVSYHGYFNSYMAASPQHPVLHDYLQLLLHYYMYNDKSGFPFRTYLKRRRQVDRFSAQLLAARSALRDMSDIGLIGPFALKAAVLHRHRDRLWSTELLFEQDMEDVAVQETWYPQLEFQTGGHGCCCNFVVHNPRTKVPYFFSRVVGASENCDYDKAHQPPPNARPLSWPERQALIPSRHVEYIHT